MSKKTTWKPPRIFLPSRTERKAQTSAEGTATGKSQTDGNRTDNDTDQGQSSEDTYSLLAQKYNLTDDCVVPVKDASNQEELIIIYDPSCNTERTLKEFGHNVMIRNQKYVSNEGAVVSSICKNKQYPIRPEDKHILKQVLNHHAKRLFASHSNLNIITTSPVKSKKKRR
ncbi:hypothetical protein KP79_PYT02013 [Mizuhopecten yessoensis]|uniref:Uncharacterized protein n=1 Tax=Mizuhopecten yessoensis TaxID=6573 RepID=A0A210Q1V2_MIZYE|nr:hypothetical protein KP79_PYT02013 [Mizuhopecten yessoensis]